MEDEVFEAIRQEAEKLMPPFGTHGFEHTLRVYNRCRIIGVLKGADLSTLLPAALLHDIIRDENDHENASSLKAREILKSLDYPANKIEDIAKAINVHSFSGGLTPDSLEARILSDADKLDAMGAIGVYRAAMYCVGKGRSIEEFVSHFHEKLLRLKDLLYTEEGKHLAESRHKFMIDFLEQLGNELRFVDMK
ncbi:MAG: HD domain-containing protein [Nitrososphaeria archaeon]|nr:HD domain-containing protein [Nitrososphaeria archaeon]